ncbi:hypothetical protein K8I31_09325 [bacterium]|nr:hypothetical protein [bacterium]
MNKLNMIFFDGVSGSGKSTTSQLVYLDLLRKGLNAKWHYEHAVPHPILESREVEFALQNQLPPEAVVEQVCKRVVEFVKQHHESGELHLFESCIYQLFAGCLFRMNQDREAISNAVHDFETRLGGANAQLVYFVQPDVGAALRMIADKRGEGFDQYLLDQFSQTPYVQARGVNTFDELIQAYVEFRELTDDLYEASLLRKTKIVTSANDWDGVMRDVSAFLGYGDYQGPAAPARPLDEYAGRYQEATKRHAWKLKVDGAALRFDDAHQMRAFPYFEDVFLLEAAPIELRFTPDNKGRIQTLRCEGNVLNEPVVGTVWKKIR